MNLSEMRTMVQNRGFGTDTAGAQTAFINAAYRRVVGDHHWPFLEAHVALNATTIGDVLVSGVPADILHFRTLSIFFPATGTVTERHYPEYLSLSEYQRYENEGLGDHGPDGLPLYWTHRELAGAATQILLLPAPDRVYGLALNYFKDPPVLVADGDTPILPAAYHDILVDGALAEMAARHRDWAMHDRFESKFRDGVARMKAQLGIEQQQNSGRVVQSGFFREPVRWPER